MQTIRTFSHFSAQFADCWPLLGWTAFDAQQRGDSAAARVREGREKACRVYP
jgi:hypothetical protein